MDSVASCRILAKSLSEKDPSGPRFKLIRYVKDYFVEMWETHPANVLDLGSFCSGGAFWCRLEIAETNSLAVTSLMDLLGKIDWKRFSVHWMSFWEVVACH